MQFFLRGGVKRPPPTADRVKCDKKEKILGDDLEASNHAYPHTRQKKKLVQKTLLKILVPENVFNLGLA